MKTKTGSITDVKKVKQLYLKYKKRTEKIYGEDKNRSSTKNGGKIKHNKMHCCHIR